MAFFRYRTLQFLYGLEANLPATGYNVGEPYFTTDDGHLYIATSPSTKVKFYNSTEVDILLAKSVTGLYQGKHRYFGTQDQIRATTGNNVGDTAIASNSTVAGQVGAKGTYDGSSWTFTALEPAPMNGMYADIESLLDYPYPDGDGYFPGEIRWSDDGINPAKWVQLPESRNAPDGITIDYNSQGQVSLKPITTQQVSRTTRLGFGGTFNAGLTAVNQYGQVITETTTVYTLPSEIFTATQDSVAGKNGLVPAPSSLDEKKFLNAAGNWQEVRSNLNTIVVDTTKFTESGSVVAGTTDITGYAYLLFLNGLFCIEGIDYSLSYTNGNLIVQWLKTAEIPSADSWMRILYFA